MTTYAPSRTPKRVGNKRAPILNLCTTPTKRCHFTLATGASLRKRNGHKPRLGSRNFPTQNIFISKSPTLFSSLLGFLREPYLGFFHKFCAGLLAPRRDKILAPGWPPVRIVKENSARQSTTNKVAQRSTIDLENEQRSTTNKASCTRSSPIMRSSNPSQWRYQWLRLSIAYHHLSKRYS